MKFLFDFFPIILFFIAFQVTKSNEEGVSGNAYIATGVLMAATLAQFLILWIRKLKIENLHKINLGLVVVLGGATILFQNKDIISWKVSIINWLFGIVFLASQYFTQKPIVQRMMESAIQVPQAIWNRLNLAWVVFFIFVGFLNLYIMKKYSFDTWVNFKFYGLLGLTFAFVLIQAFYLQRHISPLPEEEPGPKKQD